MFIKTLVALTSLALFALADSVEFGLITIRSGSAYQYSSVFPKDGELYVGSSDVSYKYVVTDAGELKVVNDGSFATVTSNGHIEIGSDAGSTKFFVKDGYLQYDTTSTGFSVEDSSRQLLVGSAGTGVILRTVTDGAATAPDFVPSDESSASVTTFSTVINKNSTNTNNSTTPPVSIEEGAANYLRVGGNVVGLAAMAALLL